MQSAQICRGRENYEKYYQNTVHKFSTQEIVKNG